MHRPTRPLRTCSSLAFLAFAAAFAMLQPSQALSQAAPPATATPASETSFPELRTKLLALREAFIQRATASGLVCHIPPPKIVIVNIPSFGNYEPETNTLMTPDWSQLDPDGKAVFFRIAGPNSTEDDAHREFELGAHRWVYIHELGHWTQACQHTDLGGDHYAVEYGADRIDAAYWHEVDPAFIDHMYPIFNGLITHAPSPVPPGLDKQKYFNDNYEKLGPTPSYIWFQAGMCVDVFNEKPAPTLAQALGLKAK